MQKKIKIEDYLTDYREWPLLDVRSPGEFVKGHIPGAHSLPLFSDAERAEVGRLYKQVNPDTAFLRGLEFAGAKLRQYVEQARTVAPTGKIVVQCWRGGQRSASMAWLLERAGFEVITLAGGYKAFRRYALAYFVKANYQLLVLGGATGSGKTAVLQEMINQGLPVIDLEGMAHHKGSAFGALGETDQPSTEQFENDLFIKLLEASADQAIWVEYESKGIGRVFLPSAFYERMCTAPLIQLEVPIDLRITHLVKIYGHFEQKELIASFEKIRKRLGGLELKNALNAIAEDDLATAARIALAYYDKTYFYGLDNKHQGEQKLLKIDEFDVPAIVNRLKQMTLVPS